LKGIALTDHDTLAGIREAFATGLEIGVAVLPGVELSAEWGEQDVHILGYWVSQKHRDLTDLMQRLRCDRANRVAKIVQRLGALGLPLTMAEVVTAATSHTDSLGRPHVARALVARGYVDSMEAAFARYLDRGRPAYVPRYKLGPEDAVMAIVGGGGVAVWAHPGALASDLIEPLVEAGLTGIEVFHPHHDPAREAALSGLALRYGLVITGGSDAHDAAELGIRNIGLNTWFELWSRK